jgi:cell division cycle 20-like protein 1 (cofactor of APC complex)
MNGQWEVSHFGLPSCLLEEANRVYEQVLKSELFPNVGPSADSNNSLSSPGSSSKQNTSPSRNILQFRTPQKPKSARRLNFFGDSPHSEKYSMSAVGSESQRLLLSPRKSPRHISKVPFKVLDAPELQDDFYLNLVDWSSSNILGVGLGTCVYLWSACTSKVTKLCDLGPYDSVTSVNWIQRVRQSFDLMPEEGKRP